MVKPELAERSESICGFPPPTEIKGENWKMVDAKLGVVSSTLEGLPQWVKNQFLRDTPFDDVNSLTFFYHQGVDAVVLNNDHTNADLYELLVTAYLSADAESRRELKDRAPTNRIGTTINLLDFVIAEREKRGSQYGRS